MKNKTKIVAALLGGSALLANNKNIKQKDNSRLEEFEYIEKDNFKDLEVKTKTSGFDPPYHGSIFITGNIDP
jgi:hypothetical protein